MSNNMEIGNTKRAWKDFKFWFLKVAALATVGYVAIDLPGVHFINSIPYKEMDCVQVL